MPLENNRIFLGLRVKLILGLSQKCISKLPKLLYRFRYTLTIVLLSLNAHAQIANTISSADKVFGLSKFWQEVNYNFVYLNKMKPGAWDSAYKALIPVVEATKNDYEYYRVMQKFCALLRDGHTEVSLPAIKGLDLMSNMFGDYLLVLKRIDNKVIIKRTWKKDAQRFPIGSEIVEVNGLPIETYISDSIAPYISSSTDYVRNEIAAGVLLMGAAGSTFTIKLRKPNGEDAVYALTHARTKDSVFFPNPGVYPDEQKRNVVEWKRLPKNITYVAVNSFIVEAKADSIFESLLPNLEQSKGIIIDLRYNGGGDDGVAFNILKHFIKDSVIRGSSAVLRTFDPFLRAIGRYINVADTVGNKRNREAWLLYNGYTVYDEPSFLQQEIKSGTRRLPAPVAILTSHYTESAAEDFLIAADNQQHIIRIGEPTNGSSGMPYRFNLPGGGSARICIKKDTYPDGREFVGYGIQPDIRVTPTIKDYLENRDVVLEAALKYFETGAVNIRKSTHN